MAKSIPASNLKTLPPELDPRKIATKETENYLFFYSAASPLSNFHPSTFIINGETYTCGEEYIQTSKARFFKDHETYKKIKVCASPGQMKALGSNVKGFNSAAWATCVENVATKCQLEKFSQNKELRDYLLSTESKSLIEASPKDSFWGIGISLNDPDIIKINLNGSEIFRGSL